MKECVALRHVAFEDLGLFEGVLAEHGYQLRYVDAVTDSLEGLEDVALLVILGGPLGVYQQEDYPFLKDEIALVARRIGKNLPTLGLCLGSQIMAAALGARVYPGGRGEVGWSPLEITAAGMRSPLRHLAGPAVFHWHGDTFDLPAGAELLASTPVYPHQAFSLGPRVLALQFHPEVTPLGLERWYVGHCCELANPDRPTVATLRSDAQRYGEGIAAAGPVVLREWLAGLG